MEAGGREDTQGSSGAKNGCVAGAQGTTPSEKKDQKAEKKAKALQKHGQESKSILQKPPDADTKKVFELAAPNSCCDAGLFAFEKLVIDGGVDLKAFPNLRIDSSRAHLPNDEQATPAQDEVLLKANLRDCLKTFADFGYLDGTCEHHHPINLYIHPPVYTCGQAARLVQPSTVNSAHMKNLFVKDKKKNLFLITALADTEIKLGKLKLKGMASGGASFASSDVLLEALGLIPGSVTPFGLINDSSAKVEKGSEGESSSVPKVTFYLDENALKYDYLCVHPNSCNASVDVHCTTFVKFIESVTGHEVNILEASQE